MATAVRLVSAVVVGLLFADAAVAQTAPAPPPRIALSEVAKEYHRLGMPLPPPDAPLVRIECMVVVQGENDPGGVLRPAYTIGFRLPPRGPGKDPRYLVGYGYSRDWWIDPATAQVAEPTPDALRGVELDGEDWLCFVAQCEWRGWHDLARAAYARAWEYYAFITSINGDPEPSPIKVLRLRSYRLCLGRLDQPGTDRKEIVRQLRQKIAEEPSIRTDGEARFLRNLELTVAPRRSKPGTVEALIDDLTEYWQDAENPSNTAGQEAYWKLAELGFDAVPALIKHLDDDRYSRAAYTNPNVFNNSRLYGLTVGHLCSQLLYDLSARKIGGGHLAVRGDRIDPEKAQEWFAAAQKVGEEKWLLDHAVPEGEPQAITNQDGRPEPLIVRVIGAKYPQRLPEIYRAMLKKKSSSWTNAFVPEILASKLTREQKIALFEEGTGHDDMGHRTHALEALAALDLALLRKHLLKTLQEAPARAAMGKGALPDSLDPLLTKAGDPACWNALPTAAKQLPPGYGFGIIWEFRRGECPPDEDDPVRRERLRLLVQFLDDRSTDPDAHDLEKHVEIRDYAATYLGALLRFPVERLEGGHRWYSVQHDRDRGTFSRLFFREAVRRAALRELAVKG